MLAVVDACSPDFTGESYMFNKQTNPTCSPQFRGESYMFILKWHVHPGRVELHMSFFYDRLYQRVKHSERHDLTFMDSFAMITFDIVTSWIHMFI